MKRTRKQLLDMSYEYKEAVRLRDEIGTFPIMRVDIETVQ